MAAPFAACCGAPREPVRCERAKESKGSLSLSLQQQIAARAALLCICQILLCLAVCFSALRAMLRQTESCRANTIQLCPSLSHSLSLVLYVCVSFRRVCIFIYKHFSAFLLLLLLLSVCFDGIRRRRIVLIIYTLFYLFTTNKMENSKGKNSAPQKWLNRI